MDEAHFSLLRQSEIDACIDQAGTALQQWEAAWAGWPGCSVSCVAAYASGPAVAEWQPRLIADGTTVWLHASHNLEAHLEHVVFALGDVDASAGRHHSSALAASLASQAMDALLAGIVTALTGQSLLPTGRADGSPQALLRYGAGGALVTVGTASHAVRLLLPHALVRRLCRTTLARAPRERAAPQGVRAAVRELDATLRVEVGHAELTLAHLQTLAVGDVIALGSRVDRPLALVGEDGTVLCHAHLGTVAGRRAVELMTLTQ